MLSLSLVTMLKLILVSLLLLAIPIASVIVKGISITTANTSKSSSKPSKGLSSIVANSNDYKAKCSRRKMPGVIKSVSVYAASLNIKDRFRIPKRVLYNSSNNPVISSLKNNIVVSQLPNPSGIISKIKRSSIFTINRAKKAVRKIENSIPSMPTSSHNSNNKKKKVLILMSDTGGGHRASAQAIDQALKEQFHGQFSVQIMDIWTDHANYPFNRFVPTYRYLAANPLLWRLFYTYGHFPPTKLFTEVWSKQNSYQSFKNAIVSADPDIVVSVHPLCQLMPLGIVGELNKNRKALNKGKIPFVTVVTDLGGAHSTWFDKRVDKCFIPSDEVYKIATKNGLKSDKLIQRGLPIRPQFWRSNNKSKEKMRHDLGLDPNAKTILLMGGGDGVGGLQGITKEVAKKLKQSSKPSQVVVICGHNKKVSKNLLDHAWPENVKVHVKGFCNNIDEYMTASDCLVTKAGPGTIAEAMVRGLPIIISSFLPGQEAGNVPYVTNGGFGVYTGNNPTKIANTVFDFFHNDKKLHSMSSQAMQLSRPDATKLIAKDLGEMCIKSSQQVLSFDNNSKQKI